MVHITVLRSNKNHPSASKHEIPATPTHEITLKRELGVLGSFSIGFADVGADIYVALGLVIFFALGAAPLALGIAGVAYVFTAISYAELSAAIPLAGGGSIFSREAFGDFWGFIAGWGLMLAYVIDIALFAWFSIAYLGSFFHNIAPLAILDVLNPVYANGSYSFQMAGTITLILLLLLLNYTGIKESASLNIALGMFCIASEVFLLIIGFLLVWNGKIAWQNFTQLGSSISWSQFGWGITVAMVAFIGLESISQAAEETANPGRIIPLSTKWLIVVVLTLSLTLSILAIGIAPNSPDSTGQYPAFSPVDIATRFENDPMNGIALGVVTHQNIPIITKYVPMLVLILGFCILMISTNTGIIGASRVTYSMGRYHLLSRWFSKVHGKRRVPHRTIFMATLTAIGFVVLVYLLATYHVSPRHESPTVILADMYAFGALVSFMLVNLAMLKLRNSCPNIYRPWKSPLTLKFRRKSGEIIEIPVTAVLGFGICFVVWLLLLSMHEVGRVVGFVWFVTGIWLYMGYRFRHKHDLNEPLKGTKVTDPRNVYKLHPDRYRKVKLRYLKLMEKIKIHSEELRTLKRYKEMQKGGK